MGEDKVGSNINSSSSFFHLFDWSRRARKKLLSSDHGSSVLCSGIEGEVEKTQHGHDEHRSASSEIGNVEGSRGPGAVARLMGLDSLPASGISTPLHHSQSSEDGLSQISGPELYISNHPNLVPMKNDIDFRKPVELQSQKMPSSRADRFHMDALPPRLAKTIPATRHKLLAGAKHPGPGPGPSNNTTFLTERATDYLVTELPNTKAGKSLSFGPSSNSSKVFHSREIIAAPKKKSATRIAMLMPMYSSKGLPVSRRQTGSEITAVPCSFPDLNDTKSIIKVDKSKPFRVLSKIEHQRCVSLSKKNGHTMMAKDNDKLNFQKPAKSQSNRRRDYQQKKPSATNASSVLRQNNQKQNHVSSKSNIPKPSSSNQHSKSALSGDPAIGKERAVKKHADGFRKESLEAAQPDKERLQLKNVKLTKNRSVEQGSYSKGNMSMGKRSMARHGKQVTHNVVIDEPGRWRNDNLINFADVVSFTFTSPIRKSLDVSQTSSSETRMLDAGARDKEIHSEITPNLDNIDLSSSDSHILEGDSLGKLIERKLMELTSGTYSSHSKLSKGGDDALPASVMDDSASSAISSTFDTEHDTESLLSACSNKVCGTFEPSNCLSADETFSMSHEPQEEASRESLNSSLEIEELDCEDQFPVPTLGSAYFNGSSYPPESNRSSLESKINMHSAAMVAVDTATCNVMNKTNSLQSEMELSDSTSTLSLETLTGPLVAEFSHDFVDLWEEELDYLKEILSSINFSFEDLAIYPVEESSFGILDPLIFDGVEENRSLAPIVGEGKQCRIERKMLFDSLNECLGSKSSRYFQTGYRSWAKGVATVGDDLAEEVYGNISDWSNNTVGEWMVDKLVERDLITNTWRWINFETEAFETLTEIGRGVLNCLIEEIVVELF